MEANVDLEVDAHLHAELFRERVVLRQARLGVDEPLDPRYAFFVQLEFDGLEELRWYLEQD